jgi:hypothetical protein
MNTSKRPPIATRIKNDRLRDMPKAAPLPLVGYMRVSKADGSQTLDLQQDALDAAGVPERNIYSDTASGKRDDRPGLDSCLKALLPGDNYPERRIASSRNAPERTGCCLTRMLPSPRHIVNRDPEDPAFLFDRGACFPAPTWRRSSHGALRRGREERSHPEPRAARSFARAWRGWRAPDLPRSEHRGILRTSRTIRPPPLH